jgi:hypothetical protein
MADANTADTATDANITTTTTDTSTDTDDTTDWKAEAEKFKALHKKQEERAKANAKAAQELEQLRQQTMTDTEKAVAQARNEGKAEAMSLLGAAKVESAFAIAASGRIESDSLKVLLQGLNHGAFLAEDGTVDESSVATFIDGIAPKADPNRRVDLGQGARLGGKSGPGGTTGDPLVDALTRISRQRQ